jgi:hypothetical protein
LEAANHSDLAWIEPNVFVPSCGNFTSCHNGGASAAGRIDLKNAGMSHGALVGRDSAVALGRKLVVAGQPKQSYLLVMMQQFPPEEMLPTPVAMPPTDIGFMPQNSPPLCCQKLDAVERWIAAGAAQ